MKIRSEDNKLHSKDRQQFKTACPCCFAEEMTLFHQVKSVPVNSVLNLKTHDKAVSFPLGDIALGFCDRCGFISNIAFDSMLLDYSADYESTQSFSPTYTAFARRQAKQLIERHKLFGKDLLEIGCGNGEFLTLLCELGDNRGLGFDPAFRKERLAGRNEVQAKFIKDFYSEKYGRHSVDFVYCRMTLEHIPQAAEFVSMVRRSIGEHSDVVIFFQVPDVTRILRDCAFEDIYYEHCSYFSPGSLARLFRRIGFGILALNTDYAGQYIMLEASAQTSGNHPVLDLENDLEKLKHLKTQFGNNCQRKLDEWQNRLQHFKLQGSRTVLWGSGSKGVAFLTALKIQKEIKYVVDINPHRQGCHMAGTGHPIVAPSFLREYKPDIVIIMNPVYREEIRQQLCQIYLYPQIITLEP